MKKIRFHALVLFAALLALRVSATFLPAGTPDAKSLLAPPPVRGSAEDKLDLENTYTVHTTATAADITLGQDENKLTIFHFAPAIGGWFVPGRFPLTEALFKEVEAEAKQATDDAKNYFKRPRPYHVAPDRFPHSIEHEDPKHYSYPSGHSTRGTVFALLLAEIFPDKREAILAKGREVGWLRVQGGVHYPTDIQAGRVLGQELVRDFLRSPEFQAELAAASAELAAK
jgi:acid phosphatase (class A)